MSFGCGGAYSALSPEVLSPGFDQQRASAVIPREGVAAFYEPMDQVRRAKIRRLQLLRLRKAQSGYETPPHVVMEIEDIAGELGGRAAGGKIVVERDLGHEMTLLAQRVSQFIVFSMVASSAALIMAVADFVLILALRGS
jgi:hypothetical protein